MFRCDQKCFGGKRATSCGLSTSDNGLARRAHTPSGCGRQTARYDSAAPSESRIHSDHSPQRSGWFCLRRFPKRSGMNPELLALGENIRRLRRSLKISQEELAEKCELHRTYLSDLERGNRNLSFLSLLAVARGLGLTISELTRNVETGGAQNPSTVEPVVRPRHRNR